MVSETELRALSRKELQACAKKHGVKANGSNETIIASLLEKCEPAAQSLVQEETVAVESEVPESKMNEEHLNSLSRKELQTLARSHGVKANGSCKAIIAALLSVTTTSGENDAKSAVEEEDRSQETERIVVEMTLDEYLNASPVQSSSGKKKDKRSRGSKKSTESKVVNLPSPGDIEKAIKAAESQECDGADSIAFSALRKDMKIVVQLGDSKKSAAIKRKSNTYVRVELENGDEEKLDESCAFFQYKLVDGEVAAAATVQSRQSHPKMNRKAAPSVKPTPVKRSITTPLKSPLGRSTPGLGPAERKRIRTKVPTPAIYRQPSIPPKMNRLTEVREELAKKRKSQANHVMAEKRNSIMKESFNKISKTKIATSSRTTKSSVTRPVASKSAVSSLASAASKSLTATTPGKTPDFNRIHKKQFDLQTSIAEKGKRTRPAPSEVSNQTTATSTSASTGERAHKRMKTQVEESENSKNAVKVAPESAGAIKKRRKSTVPQPFQLGTTRDNFTFKPYSGALRPVATTGNTDENEVPSDTNVIAPPTGVQQSNTVVKMKDKGKGKGMPREIKNKIVKRSAARA